MSDERTIETVVAGLRKQFGPTILMQLKDAPLNVPVISTGSLNVDHALGIGGVPRGRITEIWGPEGAGKTTLAQHIVAEAQKNGGVAVYIDLEHKTDARYMAACGVDLNRLYLSQPQSGTVALDLVRNLITSNQVDAIIVDSVSALVSSVELDASAGDHFVGVQARMMSQNLKAIVGALGLSRTALVFLNQTRMKIGVMHGSPETTSGGVALRFYSSVRMRISRIKNLGVKGKEYGIQSRVKIRKNCVAAPWQEVVIDIEWGKGIVREADVLDAGVLAGAVSSSGGWYALGDIKIGHGREAAKAYLAEHPALVEEIRQKVLHGAPSSETEMSDGED